ncbi:MAG: hypothetical protein ACYSSL_08930 [Planctomycetota bacterium]
MPTTCPGCGSDVAKDTEGVYIRCTNPDCTARTAPPALRNVLSTSSAGGKWISKPSARPL